MCVRFYIESDTCWSLCQTTLLFLADRKHTCCLKIRRFMGQIISYTFMPSCTFSLFGQIVSDSFFFLPDKETDLLFGEDQDYWSDQYLYIYVMLNITIFLLFLFLSKYCRSAHKPNEYMMARETLVMRLCQILSWSLCQITLSFLLCQILNRIWHM